MTTYTPVALSQGSGIDIVSANRIVTYTGSLSALQRCSPRDLAMRASVTEQSAEKAIAWASIQQPDGPTTVVYRTGGTDINANGGTVNITGDVLGRGGAADPEEAIRKAVERVREQVEDAADDVADLIVVANLGSAKGVGVVAAKAIATKYKKYSDLEQLKASALARECGIDRENAKAAIKFAQSKSKFTGAGAANFFKAAAKRKPGEPISFNAKDGFHIG